MAALVAYLRKNFPQVEVVSFDLDGTATLGNSRGAILKTSFEKYLDKASPDFVKAVPALLKAGYRLAMATFSDRAHYSDKKTPARYLAGEDLVEPFLEGLFGPAAARKFFVSALHPAIREARGEWKARKCAGVVYHDIRKGGPDDNKNCGLHDIAKHYGVRKSQVLLLDDNLNNVMAAREAGFQALRVDPAVGFSIRRLQEGFG